MFDLEIELPNTPGSLSKMGRVLGDAKVSVEGGGAWVVGDVGVAHFLFACGDRASRALSDAGFRVLAS
ncbi:MAG: amino acid-binding ACT domain-containing protein, partial [Pseudomonadota bacterium]